MIDAHVYSIPAELHVESPRIAGEEAVLRALHRHPEGPRALSLSLPGAILESMDRAGIDRSALVSLPWRDADLCRRNNDHVLSAVADCGRFLAVCAVQCADPSWEKEAERVRLAGAAGLKINTGWQGGRLDSARVRAVADYVRDHDMFLMTHVDHAFKESGTGPAALFSLAGMCPETRIVAAHLGGLLGLYALHPPVARRLRNVWFDTAVSGTLEMVDFCVRAGLGDRLIFGSDFPFNHSHSQAQVVEGIRALDLPGETLAAVMHGNFAALLGGREGTR